MIKCMKQKYYQKVDKNLPYIDKFAKGKLSFHRAIRLQSIFSNSFDTFRKNLGEFYSRYRSALLMTIRYRIFVVRIGPLGPTQQYGKFCERV